ncbi:MAG: methyltransferase domain-containing protein [Candidatus Eremiobacteraeota bacterium]|nr:methyltransferase domain-containing protein [Candidatus Eremiobacteraeota bacterium]
MSGSERMDAASPHPLARQLIDRLSGRPGCRILELGTGSGRNAAALLAAGFRVHSIDDDRERTAAAKARCAVLGGTFATSSYAHISGRIAKCSAALSTHALLHGTPSKAAHTLAAVRRVLEPSAPFFGTFGSTRDARFGAGTNVEPFVFAPERGEESGVAHAYYDRDRLDALLSPTFVIEQLEEIAVDEIVGTWAHASARGAVHWFAHLRARPEGR